MCFRGGGTSVAFTLSELLVTLGIIGVIAALTMPALISNHRKKVYETQFKVAHSLVSQAVDQLAEEKFDINMFYCGTTRRDATENAFIKDFAKYFQVVKSDYSNLTDLLTRLGYPKANFNQSGPGWNNFKPDAHNNGAIFLNNGMMIASSGCWWRSIYVDFIVDTNGVKGPNKFGYDVFYFQIGKDNRLYPSSGNYDLQSNTNATMEKCCNFKQANTCSIPMDTGVSCALYAVQNISPHDTGKGYWESLP